MPAETKHARRRPGTGSPPRGTNRAREHTLIDAPPAHPIHFSNLDKVLYPATGFTKQRVIEYYLSIAPIILPYLRDRPLTLKRYPNGISEKYFYEKRCPSHKPEWVTTARLPSGRHGSIDYCVVDSPDSLAWVANLASLELHPLLCRADKPNQPTTMVFDLDPGPPADLLDCLRLAVEIRGMFEHLGLRLFPKTSGGNGLHLYLPLNSPVTFAQTKSFARAVARTLERSLPDRVTANMSKTIRPGKVFVDWSQNDPRKTTVCPYSLRARPEPTVSTPLQWREIERALSRRDATQLTFTAGDLSSRLKQLGDIFAPVLDLRQNLPR